MNTKMTFPELVEAVAAATSSPKRVSEIFLKELFATVADTLRSGENVRVRNLGLFKLTNVESRKSVNVNTGEEMEIPSHRKVTFVPEKSLADAINMPFASFETVVLEDDLTEDDLRMMSSIDDFDDFDDGDNEVAPVGVAISEAVEAPEMPIEPEVLVKKEEHTEEKPVVPPVFRPVKVPQLPEVPKPEEQETDTVKEELINEPIENNMPTENVVSGAEDRRQAAMSPVEVDDYCIPEDDDDEEYVKGSHADDGGGKKDNSFMRGFIWGAVTMFVFYLILGGGYFMYQHAHNQEIIDIARGTDSIGAEDAIEELAVAPDDASEPAAEAPSDAEVQTSAADAEKSPAEPAKPTPQAQKVAEPVYDTVTERQFLTKIAAKHYGHADFWVYIYEENRSIIKNPNTIAPGTKVVIPPASKYGIDKDNPESLRAARKKIKEIEGKK